MLRIKREIGQSVIVEDAEPVASVTLVDLQKGIASITLELACVPGDSIDLYLAGETIRVEVGDAGNGQVKVGIGAPPALQIRRGELPRQAVAPTS